MAGGPGPVPGAGTAGGPVAGPVQLPHGGWPSPLPPEVAAAGAVRFGGVQLAVGADGAPVVRWVESRPAEGGRSALVRWSGGTVRDIGPSDSSARSLVNEYGGGAAWADAGRVWWVEASTQALRCIDDDPSVPPSTAPPLDLVPAPPRPRAWRYAAGRPTPDGRWLVVERELHVDVDGTAPDEPVNDLAAVRTRPGVTGPAVPVTLVRDGDFVAAPAVSPDGRHVAWLRWDHPDLPWDAAELWAGRWEEVDGVPRVVDRRRVAGGPDGGRAVGLDRAVSACLPEWSADGRLWWVDDTDDWWQLRVAPSAGLPGPCDGLAPVLASPAEVGEPRWVSGGCRHGVADGGRVVFVATSAGTDGVWVLEPGSAPPLPLPGPAFTYVEQLAVHGHHVALVGGSPTLTTSVWLVDLSTGEATDLRGAPAPLPPGATSVPEPVAVPVPGGDDVVHGLFFPPRSELAVGPPGELPPLVVRIHGGPTAAARAELSTSVQFWTTRGFAVVEVNHRGSTGYGRRYRDLLRGNWGVVDVEDCIALARGLADAGRVAPGRAVIRGGSAGGFTALAVLCADGARAARDGGPTVVAAGCSLYGVTDLAALAADTHKFESRYLEGLVGPLPAEQRRYDERSPLRNAGHVRVPVLLLQGAQDPVVPLAQARELARALDAGGVPHELVVFPDEAHGFRNGDNIVAALRAELAFYARVLGLPPTSAPNPPVL